MPDLEMICLANSRKHGGRCVAGLRVDGTGWIRPVGAVADGTLYPPNYHLNDGTEVGVLDLIRLGSHTQRAAFHQPENWMIDRKQWMLVARPVPDTLVHVLRAAIQIGPELLRGFSDRVSVDSLQQQPVSASLTLIAPDEMELYHQLSYRGKPQARARFSLGTGADASLYDLVITDPIWERIVIQQGPTKLRQVDARFISTISLGEPLGLYCYKMLAAIIVLPTDLARSL